MSGIAIQLAALSGLALAAIGASLFAIFCAQRLARAAEERSESRRGQTEAEIASLRAELGACIRQIDELRQLPPASAGPARSGLNMSKRSQALRMYRRGDNPAAIAAALQVPLQEVDLLLKVHRIVISAL